MSKYHCLEINKTKISKGEGEMKIGFIETIKRVGKNLGGHKEEKFRVLAKKTTIPNRHLKETKTLHKRMTPVE